MFSVGRYSKKFIFQVGLCQNLRNLLWYEKEDSDTFYPRAYMISENEEKEEFIGTFECDLQVILMINVVLLTTKYVIL